MRIFQVLEGTTNQAVQQNQTWFRNLYEPLLELGHDVVLHSANLGRQALQQRSVKLRDRFGEELLTAYRDALAKKPIDLFFSYLMDGMIEPDVLAEIHRLGVPMVNFSCNNIHQFDLVDGISPYFDLNLYAEKDAGIKFERIRAAGYWWPMASNPRYFHPVRTVRNVDVSFVGGNYAMRAEYIAYLLNEKIDVQVFGPYWLLDSDQPWKTPLRRWYYLARNLLAFNEQAKQTEAGRLQNYLQRIDLNKRYYLNLHGTATDEELIRLYSRSRISLGFLEVYDGNNPGKAVKRHMHLREFEAPMCGALYCTGYSDELAEMFEPGKEVITYNNKEELLNKVRYYLKHQDEGEHIRQAGLKRALADHTYQRRYQTLFQKMRLLSRG
jgi:spore maturation protein CgeB